MPQKPYMQKPEQVLVSLDSNSSGLNKNEVKKRHAKYGFNKLERKKRATAFQIFYRQFQSFLIMILVVAATISALIGHMIDMIVILTIVILNAILGFFQEHKAERAMEALEKLAAPKALVIRDGKKIHVNSEDLVPGDIVLLETGDKVPADCRILESMNFRIDESALTGESTSVGKNSEPITKENVQTAELKNTAFMDTIVTGGRAKCVVTGIGMNTQIGKIATMVQEVEEKKTPLQVKLGQVGKTLGIIIVFICAIVFFLQLYRVGDLAYSTIVNVFLIAVSLAVAAVPEGLPAVITIALAVGLQKMAKSNAIVRKLPAVETLGSTTVICSDKTGTLTKNQMTIQQVYMNGKMVKVTGAGYEPKGELRIKNNELNSGEQAHLELIARAGALCNNSELIEEDWSIVGDPTEGSLIVLAEKAGLDVKKLHEEYVRTHEMEFTSERKRMSTLHKTPEKEIIAFAKGAPELLLEQCSYIYINNKARKLTPKDKKAILSKTHEMAGHALRLLGIAYKEMPQKLGKISAKAVEQNMIFLGIVGMIDPPREEVKQAIETCRRAGIKVVMITGDHKSTAQAIAKELGMASKEDEVLTGEELDEIGEEELDRLVNKAVIYARVSPEHKVRILKALKANKHIVAMTGDGVNDAPALKNADIGVAMGISGTDVAKEASDMILEDDNFTTIVKAIEQGRGIYSNIKKFIALLLSGNIGEILVVALAVFIGFTDPATGKFVLPLIAVQILWINLLTDGLPAVALSVEPVDVDVMKQKPRNPEDSLFKGLRAYLVEYPIIMFIGVISIFVLTLNADGIVKAQTMAFTTIVFFELFQSFSCRSLDKPVIKLKPFSNKYLILAIASSVVLQLSLLYIPLLQEAFHVVPLGLFDWAAVLLIASMGFIYLEGYKAYSMHKSWHKSKL